MKAGSVVDRNILLASLSNDIRPGSKYIPALDGLRAVSIALVLLGHYSHAAPQNVPSTADVFPGPRFGVTLFFFISGFLITRLFLAEQQTKHTISLPNFYLRRLLRLAPPLIAMLAGVTLVCWWQGRAISLAELSAGMFYYTNYYSLLVGVHVMPFLQPLWSLGVEEHYYVLFPLLFLLLAKDSRQFVYYLCALCALALVWRICIFSFGHDWFGMNATQVREYTYSATDCRIDSILFGAVLSVLTVVKNGEHVRRLATLPWFLVGCAGLVLSVAIHNNEFVNTLNYTIQGIALIPIFAALLFGDSLGWLRAVLNLAPMRWLGKVSYAVYLWHLPVRALTDGLYYSAGWIVWVAVSVVLTLTLAGLSYKFIEMPVARLRHKYR